MVSLIRTLLLLNCLLIFTLPARAQTVVTSAFALRPTGSRSPQAVGLGDSKSRVVQVLGPPTKTSRFYAEIDKAWWPVLHYGSSQLFFAGNRLALVELHDARLTVGQPGAAGFRVGSALPKATSARAPLAFGHFNVERKPGKTRNLGYHAISYGNMKTAKGQTLDVAYEILYDPQGRVAHIFLDETYD